MPPARRCPVCGEFRRRSNGVGEQTSDLQRMCGKCYLKEKSQRRRDGTAGRGRTKAEARKRLKEKRQLEDRFWKK